MTSHHGPESEHAERGGDAYAPLRFESSVMGRELIKLGGVTIGEILPQHGRAAKASILFRLPDAPRTMLLCRSMTSARRVALQMTRDWIEATGLRT